VYVSLNDFFLKKKCTRIIVVDRLGLNLGGANKKRIFCFFGIGMRQKLDSVLIFSHKHTTQSDPMSAG
jgi:hypothetical protein